MNTAPPTGLLVTGANGFVGHALMQRTRARGAYRDKVPQCEVGVCVGTIDSRTDWRSALSGVHTVIHLAARVHVMNDQHADPLAAFREVNTAGTLNLARQAVDSGVRRIVYVSSIKVNGESTPIDRPFRTDDPPSPQDAYARSKLEAEEGLYRIAHTTGLEVVVIRPPLVYGPGVRANFLSMINWVRRGLPLPLASVVNLRSLISVDNLVDLLVLCVNHPKAAGKTWLASDGADISTPDLLRATGVALGRPARLLPVPVGLLRAGAALLGRRAAVDRLCTSLRVEIGPARDVLGWQPPLSLSEGMRRTIDAMNRTERSVVR